MYAVQGPNSAKVMDALLDVAVDDLKRFQIVDAHVGDAAVVVDRGGFTGELGFELYCKREDSAAVAEAIGKKWPGILSANGLTLSVDWAKLIDVVAAETKGSQESVDTAKKVVAKLLGGTTSEISTVSPSPTSFRTFIGTKGFTPPPAVSGEQRLAAALPEVVAKRPSGAFYLSLYSFARDNVMPIALKVLPEDKAKVVRSIVAVMPKASDNGAIAGAYWSRKDGSSSFLLRVTKGEIQSIGAAANAIIAAQAQSETKTETQPEK